MIMFDEFKHSQDGHIFYKLPSGFMFTESSIRFFRSQFIECTLTRLESDATIVHEYEVKPFLAFDPKEFPFGVGFENRFPLIRMA